MNMIKEQLSNSVQSVLDGEISALEVYAELKELDKFLKTCIEKVEGPAQNEADKYNEKTFNFNGYEFQKRAGSPTYDFKANQDILDYENNLARIKEFLKQATRLGKSILDEDTGEVYQPVPVKYSKDILIVKKI